MREFFKSRVEACPGTGVVGWVTRRSKWQKSEGGAAITGLTARACLWSQAPGCPRLDLGEGSVSAKRR